VVLRGKFIAMNAYIKNTERSQISHLMLHLKFHGKKQAKLKTSKRREIITIRAVINETETKKKKIHEKLVP
jgi:aspartyl aminopeptidase